VKEKGSDIFLRYYPDISAEISEETHENLVRIACSRPRYDHCFYLMGVRYFCRGD
jgi:hypothetical protein